SSASSSPKPTGTRGEITFNVEGSGTVASLSYMVNGQTTKLEDVKLPWRKTVPMPLWPPRITWKLAYRAPSGGSSFTVEVDGNNVMGGQGSAGANLGAEGVY
ncbi:hypothetical protein, partial [Actinomadura sp. KC216]|uniref:hypothetical protein n=1 Tax=Actinomadura sp. KC216 TaxID=2530370 RepID=UPI001A9E8996